MLSACPPAVQLDAVLMSRLSRPGPRYASYPTADRFSDAFGYRDYLHAIADLRTRGSPRPLSLYVHIPFCATGCHYCACSKIVARNPERAVTYLAYLRREIDMLGRLFAGMNEAGQLHFGGGTPIYLSDTQMGDLMNHLRRCFRFASEARAECAIEVDPRTVSPARVHSLRQQGFNRISLGVQDFDPDVQKALNRIQSEAQTRAVIDAARDAGFRSVGIDLVYGLPKQSVETMQATLDKVVAASPDRICVHAYLHLPHLFRPQRRIQAADLPDGAARLRMLRACIERLTAAGYEHIGMDRFARPAGELALARRQGRPHRDFEGYPAHADTNLVGCGVSAISAVGATYSQNTKDLIAYYGAIDRNELPVARGVRLTMDDAVRRTVIQQLMGDFEVSIAAIEQAFPIDFASYFARELVRLAELERDGVVAIGPAVLSVTMKGRLLVRNVCMVFDRYLTVRHGQS